MGGGSFKWLGCAARKQNPGEGLCFRLEPGGLGGGSRESWCRLLKCQVPWGPPGTSSSPADSDSTGLGWAEGPFLMSFQIALLLWVSGPERPVGLGSPSEALASGSAGSSPHVAALDGVVYVVINR